MLMLFLLLLLLSHAFTFSSHIVHAFFQIRTVHTRIPRDYHQWLPISPTFVLYINLSSHPCVIYYSIILLSFSPHYMYPAALTLTLFVQIIANLVINNRTFFPNGNDNENHGDTNTPTTPTTSSKDKTNDGNNKPTADATDDTSSKPTTPTGSHDTKPSNPATATDSATAAAMASTRSMAMIALVLAIGAFVLALYSAVVLTCRKGQVVSLLDGTSSDGYGGDSSIVNGSNKGGGSYQHSRVGGGNGGVRNEDLGFVVTRGTAPGRGGYSSVHMT